MSVIRIPIAGTSEEVIEIQKDNLPSNEEMDGLLGTLMAEMAPLNVWMQFAAEYYKQGKMAQFVTLMEEVTEIDEEEVLKKYTVDERVKCFNVFAGYFIESAGKSKESEVKKDDQFFKANQVRLFDQKSF
jgi:RNA polymerase-associated protein CTR9